MTADGDQGVNGQVAKQPRQAPARVASSTRVAVAFPFSQVKIQEPSGDLVALTALVADLADLVAATVADPRASALRERAHDLAAHVG
jgi:hypothetical protein